MVCFCFLLSGFAALLYQTAWLRLFSTFYGTSEYAVTIVLASYMSGLALGAWIAKRYLHRIQFPILVYGFLELLIAVSALCVPLLMKLSSIALSVIVGGQMELPDAGGFVQPAFYLVASMIIIGIPTTCMGATLPILMRHVIKSKQQIGRRTGLLYGINTVGAVFGTIAAAFVLLPAVGMKGTVWLGVSINILIYLIAIIIVLAHGFDTSDRVLKPQLDLPFKSVSIFKDRQWILPLMFVSGLVSFTYEVLWTRLIGHVIGGSVAAFATMLAAFLTGIALGGFLGGLLARTKGQAIIWFVIAQLLIGLLSIFVYYKIDGFIPDVRNIKAHAKMAYAVMVPATLFIGMTFPLAVRILSDNASEASGQAARVFTWNTLGAVIGALMAGFIIIPVLGFEGTIVFCVVANLAIALCVILAQSSARQKWIPAILCLALIAGAGAWRPDRPNNVINHSLFALNSGQNLSEEYYGVGRSATVLSLSSFNEVFYRSNGLPESNVLRQGASPLVLSQQWLGAIPPLLRPHAENMLIVGYGGGASLEAIPQHIKSIDVVELEPKVIEANRATAHLRSIDPLTDPRVNIVLNDARNALQLSRKKFDIIVSQPSHPWTAGASHLFTREYMSLAKRHLNRDGVFLQWINAEFVTETLLRDLAATLVSEFKYVRMAQVSPNALHFYASDAPLDMENNLPEVASIVGADPNLFASIGVNSVLDVLATIVLDEKGTRSFANTGKIIRDDRNQLAAHSRQFGRGLNNGTLMNLLKPYDPFVHGASLNIRDMNEEHTLYTLGALVRLGMINRAWDAMKILDTDTFRTLATAAIYKANRNDLRARETALQVVDVNGLGDAAPFISTYSGQTDRVLLKEDIDTASISKDLAIVFELTEAGQREDWQKVLDQDEALIQIPVTRVYAAQAFSLRAQSRAALKTEKQDMEKALALIERAYLLEPSIEKLDLRANLADRLKDGHRVVNSLWQINNYLVVMNARGQNMDGTLADYSGDSLQIKLDEYENMLGRIAAPELENRVATLRSLFARLKKRHATEPNSAN